MPVLDRRGEASPECFWQRNPAGLEKGIDTPKYRCLNKMVAGSRTL